VTVGVAVAVAVAVVHASETGTGTETEYEYEYETESWDDASADGEVTASFRSSPVGCWYPFPDSILAVGSLC